MKLASKPGDVLAISIDNRSAAIAQVVDIYRNTTLLIACYPTLVPLARTTGQDQALTADLRAILGEEPNLMGIMFDALIKNGFWRILVNMPVALQGRPVYTEGGSIVSFEGLAVDLRPTNLAKQPIRNRTVMEPKLFDNAIKASFGVGEWKERYDKMLLANQILI